MTDLAVVIVTWHVRDMALDALRTLYADLEASNLTYRVVVVDNDSNDGTVSAIQEQFPQVELIACDENHGFSGANNIGIKHLGFGQNTEPGELPKVVYLLNPDTITHSGATQALYKHLMSDESIGLVGARLTYGDGSFQHSAFAFPGLRQLWVEFFPTPGRFIEGRFNGRYPHELYSGNEPFEVDFMLGATMMLKREVILETGMFDEAFFVYSEEVDWQWRMRNAGWKIFCVPQAHITHLVGQSTSQVKAKSVLYLWESRLKLFEKHYPTWKLRLAKILIAMGMSRKLQLAHRDKLNQDVIEAYQAVIEMAQA